jgi:hypothetical protein
MAWSHVVETDAARSYVTFSPDLARADVAR